MPESGPLGSVRGARGNLCPYRDLSFFVSMLEDCWVEVVWFCASIGAQSKAVTPERGSRLAALCLKADRAFPIQKLGLPTCADASWQSKAAPINGASSPRSDLQIRTLSATNS